MRRRQNGYQVAGTACPGRVCRGPQDYDGNSTEGFSAVQTGSIMVPVLDKSRLSSLLGIGAVDGRLSLFLASIQFQLKVNAHGYFCHLYLKRKPSAQDAVKEILGTS